MAEQEAAEEEEPAFRVCSVLVEGVSIKIFSFPDRRSGRANPPPIQWVFQKQLEEVFFARSDGGSSNPIWKALQDHDVGTSSLLCQKAAVTNRHLMQAEYDTMLYEFKRVSVAIDPLSIGSIRRFTLIPLGVAKTVVEKRGRSLAAIAFLRGINQPLPEMWELREHQEADEANRELDYVNLERIEQIEIESQFELENVISFQSELQKGIEFVDIAADETKLAQYALTPAPPLQTELNNYKLARTSLFNAKRSAPKIEEISAEQSVKCVLRFLGFVQKTNQIEGLREADIKVDFFLRPDLGALIEKFANWLKQTQQTKCSTISNYLNGLVGFLEHIYAGLAEDDAIFQARQTPLDMCTNLRAQADAEAKQEGKRQNLKGGFIEWADVQKARVKCVEAAAEAAKGPKTKADFDKLLKLLKEAAAISLSSLLPPDRVGLIRKLRFGQTLIKLPSGVWKIQLDGIADRHKTTKFYGAFAASLPKELKPVLDAYHKELSMQPGGDCAALFHGSKSDFERFMEPSPWSRWFKAMMKKWSGKEIAPKTLRQSFVTWIRDAEAAPDVLKSAAHAMKHTVQTADNTYDEGKDTRLVQAAYLFNIQFAETFAAPTDFGTRSAGSNDGAGSSGVVPPEAEGEEEEEQWEELSGGPWKAKWFAQDQSKAPDGKRLFRFEVKLDHPQFRSCARLHIPTVRGGPVGGFYLTLPITAGSATNMFPYHMPLAAAATRTATVPFNRVLIQKNPDAAAPSPPPVSPQAVDVTDADAEGGSTTSSDDEDADDGPPPVSGQSVHSADDARALLSGSPMPAPAPAPTPAPAPAPPPAPAPTPPPPVPGPVPTTRKSKRPVQPPKFHDEVEDTRPPKSPTTPETPFEDMHVPAFVQVGGLVVAEGNHATGRKFVAQVLKIRRTFPPIVVRFQKNLATGQTDALSLPDPKISHVHAGQVEQYDLSE